VLDDVINASRLTAQCEAAVDDVAGHVTVTSRRLSDVIDRARSVSASAHQQFSNNSLDIATVITPVVLTCIGLYSLCDYI